VPALDIFSRRRTADIVRVRQIGMYLARECTLRSFCQIGFDFDRDHATVLYGWRKIARLIQTDDSLRADVETIRQAVMYGK